MSDLAQTAELSASLADASATDALRWAAENFPGRVVFATSLGAEDQVITDIIFRNRLAIPVATLDTGRLFPETYDLIAETEKHYGARIQVYAPPRETLENFVLANGVNAFRESEALRHECCRIRKLESLKRLLEGKDLWICGLRRGKGVTRGGAELLSRAEANGLLKLAPLVDWSEEKVWEYIRFWNVPYNPLHDRGFPSIGCACCTRAVKRTEDVRAGRWWWEAPEHRECGLHARLEKAKELR